MIEDLLPILRNRYPEFFSHAPLREIACLPGWLDLIDELCRMLKTHMDAHPELPPIQVRQVKEKFGGLRFYYSGGDAACRETVARAEGRSLSTCEVCGQAGTLGGERWLSVRCLDHVNWSPSGDCVRAHGKLLVESMKTDIRVTVNSPSPTCHAKSRDKGAVMYRERDLAIWRSVYETCGVTKFVRLIEEALDSYKCVPRVDWPTRVHVSELGLPCVQVLKGVVSSRGLYTSISENYIEIGSRLTNHLRQQLQSHLVVNDLASDEMKEDQLGIDLGL